MRRSWTTGVGGDSCAKNKQTSVETTTVRRACKVGGGTREVCRVKKKVWESQVEERFSYMSRTFISLALCFYSREKNLAARIKPLCDKRD